MKRKRLWIGLGVLIVLVLSGIVWYKMPVRLVKMDVSEVGLIVLQNGNTGERVEIYDEDTIEKLMTDFNFVKIQRERLAIASGGYHIWIRICKSDEEMIADFTVNGSETVRRNPYFYDIVKGTIDVEYLEQLIEHSED